MIPLSVSAFVMPVNPAQSLHRRSTGGQDGPTERAASSGQRVTPVSGWVSVYRAASTSSPRIAVLRPGESAAVLEKVNAWWYKIRLSGGAVGYITSSPRYVRVE